MSLNGLILIDKKEGMTSHDVVFSLRKIIKDKQVGHIGTLDPMAEGLLVCLVGESVKLSDYLMGSNKTYRLTFKLGVETDTWDITGQVLKTTAQVVDSNVIRSAIELLMGNQVLAIPMYSAKKVDGKKLYEVARKSSANLAPMSEQTKENSEFVGVEFEGPAKDMKFWDLKIAFIEYPYVSLEFQCSKGSFVRSWVYTLGKRLGVGAALSKLQRLAIGEFSLEKATTLENLKALPDHAQIYKASYYLSPWVALKKRTIIELEIAERDKLKNGLVSYLLANRISEKHLKGAVFCFFNEQLIGILNVTEVIEVKRIFMNSEGQLAAESSHR